MLVPTESSLINNQHEIVIRDQLSAVVSMICTIVIILSPIAPFIPLTSSSWFSFFISIHDNRILTDDEDYEIASTLAKQLDKDPSAGDRFWQSYFTRVRPTLNEDENEDIDKEDNEKTNNDHDNTITASIATSSKSTIKINGRKTKDDVMLEEVWMDEIDLPVLYTDSRDINNQHSIESLVESLYSTFLAGWSRPIHQRKRVLIALRTLLTENKEQIIHAGMKDLLRPKQETVFWEYQLILTRIDHLLINLDSWTSNRSGQIRGRTMTWPSTQRIRPEPLGVVAILSNWSFPFLSALSPMAGAIAAGNTVILQPSFVGNGASASLLCSLIPKYLDRAMVSVVGSGYAYDALSQKECTKHLINCEALSKIAYSTSDDPELASFIACQSGKYTIPCDLDVTVDSSRNPGKVLRE